MNELTLAISVLVGLVLAYLIWIFGGEVISMETDETELLHPNLFVTLSILMCVDLVYCVGSAIYIITNWIA